MSIRVLDHNLVDRVKSEASLVQEHEEIRKLLESMGFADAEPAITCGGKRWTFHGRTYELLEEALVKRQDEIARELTK